MPDTSPVLELPFLQPSQAQKHVTHNEALRRLDLVVQLRVQTTDAEAPPTTPDEGEIHALGASPMGVWAGQAQKLAAWLDGSWQFLEPQPGWRAWDVGAMQLKVWTGTAWIVPQAEVQNLSGLGIGTTSDATNRLAVQASATLLNHEGSGHQLKLNKAAASDTASVLFQSNWTGHAEMGLTGDTGFSIKVSENGTSWTTALTFDPTTGLPQGNAVQANATDTTPGRLMRADYGYGPGNLLGPVSETAGIPTGAILERGSNANGEYLRFADGTQMCWTRVTSSTVSEVDWVLPAQFSNAQYVVLGTNDTSTGGLSPNIPLFNNSSSALARLNVVDGTGIRVSREVCCLAIGRWF